MARRTHLQLVGLRHNGQQGSQQRQLHLQQRGGQGAGLRQGLEAPLLGLSACKVMCRDDASRRKRLGRKTSLREGRTWVKKHELAQELEPPLKQEGCRLGGKVMGCAREASRGWGR